MGHTFSIQGIANPHPFLRPLTLLTLEDLRQVYQRYTVSLGQPFALELTQVPPVPSCLMCNITCVNQLKVLIGGDGVATRSIFEDIFDTDHNGLVDACELFASLVMLCKCDVADKIDFVHQLYDFGGSGELTFDEITIMARTVGAGCHKMDSNVRVR